MTEPIKRDRYGRYLLPDPDGGKELPWTRATTFAKSVSDTFALSAWAERMVAKGIASRPDLYALAASTSVDDKDTLGRIAQDAKDAAAASAGANLGTALHSFTEAVDRGESPVVPEPWKADVEAYRSTMARAQLRVSPEYIERIVVLPDLRVAGQFDRLLWRDNGPVGSPAIVGDVKTGKSVDYSWGEIAIQLALYAHAALIWDPGSRSYQPMPAVDLERAIVMHVPAAQGRCDLYEVDIAAGWEMTAVCSTVRTWRARRNLAKPIAVPPADPLERLRAPDRQLLWSVEQAGSVEALNALWASHARQWTPVHTAAAALRKKALLAEQSA